MFYMRVFTRWGNLFKYSGSGAASYQVAGGLGLGDVGLIYFANLYTRLLAPYTAVEVRPHSGTRLSVKFTGIWSPANA